MTWQPNVHSSLFMGIYRFLDKSSELEQVDLVIKAFRLYLEQVRAQGMPQVLSVTRAWRLVKFFDAGMLTTAPCTRCGGHFVVHAQELVKDYVCGLCEMPSRAGKTRAPQSAQARAA
jgi:flagellar transcriptional activator FlhC